MRVFIRRYRVTSVTLATLCLLFVTTAIQAQAVVNLIGVGMYLTLGFWLAHRVKCVAERSTSVLRVLGWTGTGAIASVTVVSGLWFTFIAAIDWMVFMADHGIGM